MCKHRLHIWLFAEPLDSFGSLWLVSPLPLLVLYLAAVGSFFQSLLQASAVLCVWVLFGIPNTISGWHCPPGHRGCSLRSAPASAQLAQGLSCREFVPRHLYLTQQSTG